MSTIIGSPYVTSVPKRPHFGLPDPEISVRKEGLPLGTEMAIKDLMRVTAREEYARMHWIERLMVCLEVRRLKLPPEQPKRPETFTAMLEDL